MTLPALRMEPVQLAPPQFVSLADAAARIGVSAAHLARSCNEKFARVGLAKKYGGRWFVHRRADPRLANFETWDGRDRRQLGELKAEGVPDKYIRIAEKKREILKKYSDFDPQTTNSDIRRQRFINSLLADKTIPCEGIPKLKPRTLRQWDDDYRRRGDAGGLRALVRRRYAERGTTAIGDAAWEQFLHVMSAGTGIRVTAAYDQVAGFIREQGRQDDPEWAWPSVRTIQAAYKVGVCLPARVLANEGLHKFRAKCLPKIARSYDEIAAGDVLCGDQRTLDIMAQAAGDRGPRRVRLKLTAWLDVRSRMFVGWQIGEFANSDTILGSFKSACLAMETVPRDNIIDNGLDYRAAGGPPRRNRRWDELDAKRVRTAFERLGVDVTYAQPHHPWAKLIESAFRTMKNQFDRFFPSFWGGCPDDRPWDADRWTKAHLHELPTLDEVREAFAAWLETYHEQPHRGDGMHGLSPRRAMQQHYTDEPRRITEATLDVVCCRTVGPVKVGRDGVRYQGIQYGKWEEKVFRMQGEQVWMAIDPSRADRVTLCREDGTPIVVAWADTNRGVSRDEVREAIRHQRRCERSVKDYPQSRAYLLKTRPAQIANRQKLAAQARQIPDGDLPPPPKTRSIQLVRPDIAAAAEKLKPAVGAEATSGIPHDRASANRGGAGLRRRIDYSQFANDAPAEEPQPKRRRIDFSQFADENKEPGDADE